ncbi:1-aminocyclopropane-1-carboxylate deaminase/D-cysteine desulfhydrase [Algoriphagus lacus]|uniref:1-aminocyclopropane-1-carboxylate deaminase/D-cysteine desulfhydrase n=1 Tax=Algoriphagus lacus TaxID=2056311 RepID=A0A418PSV1_9BACT|nr:pyridoxal-phosphate dependent enzyme [Algoriphagus lacus]RIW16159.1 1-aminocyclopropane-1-carboxylate deaminase/D-cysteine desulfhydrase [Algoriphagus lacus]
MLQPQPVPVQDLLHPIFEEKGIQLSILRLDLVHPEVSGNKFFKLKHNLAEAKKQGKRTLLTFGGAFSNHIYATASAAQSAGFRSIGVIRGEDADEYNPTMLHAKEMGMELNFIDRETYRQKNTPEFLEKLKIQFGDFYLIPEGGTNELAVRGTEEILEKSHFTFTDICVSIGTGGTFAGLASSIQEHQRLVGFSSLKGEFIIQEMEKMLTGFGIQSRGKLEINTDFHFGGYGKFKPELIDFMIWFHREFKIPLDPVYTGKMAFGVWNLIGENHFLPGSKILMIHTGGLQGNLGFKEKTGIKLPTL